MLRAFLVTLSSLLFAMGLNSEPPVVVPDDEDDGTILEDEEPEDIFYFEPCE